MAKGDAAREILNGRMDELNPTTRLILEHSKDETVRKAYAKLLELGLSNEKIATNAALLGMNPETIQRNYEFLRIYFSKDEIMKNAQLLGSSQETIESSVQFLSQLGIDYRKAIQICGTKVGTKRKKIAVLLKEKYGYDANLTKEERKELAEKAREFVRSRPQILRMSKKAIKRKYC